MTLVDLVTLMVGVVSVLAGLTAMVQFLVKHYLAELKPNGGASIKDQVNRLEARVETILVLLEKR